jgi:hypothetical protein
MGILLKEELEHTKGVTIIRISKKVLQKCKEFLLH